MTTLSPAISTCSLWPLSSAARIIGVLRQAEGGMLAPELRREHGISSATFYKWRVKYGGMVASMMSRMKALGNPPWFNGEDYRTSIMSAATAPTTDRSMRPVVTTGGRWRFSC